jgi:thiamine biosynthesis lipoprotein ApbE
MYCTHAHNEGVEVYLQHPLEKSIVIGSMTLKDSAFCSSSSYVRAWDKDGVKKNHFITPDGSEVWAASFVVGKTAVQADVMATVLCITSLDVAHSKKLAQVNKVTYYGYDEHGDTQGDLTFTSFND